MSVNIERVAYYFCDPAVCVSLFESPLIYKVPEKFENSLDLHFLPAKINGDGSTNVNNYFNSYTRAEHGGILSNAVRGFPLKGEILKVPGSHKAFVLQESQGLGTDESRYLYVTGSFDQFHYWNYDKIPTIADTYRQAVHLLNISEELSAPVSITEIEAELERPKNISGFKENSI